MADNLDLDLRLGHMRRAQRQAQPRLSNNLRALGAVGAYVPAPVPGSQSATVHGWFGAPKATGSYLAYMQERKGVGKTEAPLFGQNGTPVSAQQFAQTARDDPHQFRWSLSGKDFPKDLDFARYVTLFMARVEKDLGRRIDWVAAVHHDTTNVHAHIVLRGKDRDGARLYLTKDYLNKGLGYQASHLATALLGRTMESVREPSREPDRTPQHVTGVAPEPGTREHPEEWGHDDWDALAAHEQEIEQAHAPRQRDRGMGW